MVNPEDSKVEEESDKEDKQFIDEKTSFSFLFFASAGALLFVTVWAFWDDEFSRRGFKPHQNDYFKAQYARAEDKLIAADKKVAVKKQELKNNLIQIDSKLDASDEYQDLVDQVKKAEITLAEVKEKKKFTGSHLDEAYYYYKKAMHEGDNYDVQIDKVKLLEEDLKSYDPIITEKELALRVVEDKLLARKAKRDGLEKELRSLTMESEAAQRTMDFYKPYPFVWRPSAVEQTVIPGFGINNFKEIIYKVDRCQTCHISYPDPHYEDFEQPLKTHPNLDILIKKHPPERTGCTWCHLGQGTATAPAEDAHGSHHEMDQTAEINEPMSHGIFMQSTCRNCHAEVVNLEGAPILSKGKRLFLKLGCHGCHLADGYSNERKVGPRLNRISSKVDPSWLYRWVKNPKQYLPKTKMPNFGFNDKDAFGVTAYLIASSDKDYTLSKKFIFGDPDKGKKLFNTVGCLACHEIDGKGEVFGPDLTRIANKVNADWVTTWLSNPKSYNHKSLMPNLRLSKDQANDIASYLMIHGEKNLIPGIDKAINNQALIDHGKNVVRTRGCYACHDINGMESEGRIAPELSSFGRKMTSELEYGDAHIPHTWEAWARTKLKKPDSFRTERVLDKMPNFGLAPDEIDALVVLLKGFNGTKIPQGYRKNLTEKERILETGRRLITKYNCKGCHHVEGKGGVIQKYIEAKALYPPPLELGDYHVGERIKGSWLYSFLKNPTIVRKWVKVRMPTFSFTDKEVRDLTAYFEAMSPESNKYEAGANTLKARDQIETGVKAVNYMECGNCHDEGAKGIEFSIAGDRLRQNWIPKWLKHTREMIPWTKMPSHWEKKGEELFVKNKYKELKSIGPINAQVDSIKNYLISYNTAEYDDSLALGESEEDEDEGEDEDEDEDEDE
ncbi:MAG: c-type cytochrome [Nitrospinaceae bacterium]|nr:c-type cytochrome [Nitrospinaceae bacterium]